MKKILALPQAISKKAMETLNGKLVFRQPNGFNYIRFKLEYLTQQFDNLESAFSAKNLEEYEQISSLKQSVQKLETLYYRLLSTTVISSAILGILFLGMGINQLSFQRAQLENTVVEKSVSNR
ncbi:hypothetical protein [Okeania sp. SIO2B3]|uniref:hypothetical protein n=1 Tax=Okeania sp. SIO2B3 TaxID=2607784 RepID=UPI0013C1A977|nr:hypothetical protein [Okeania sp. SIO2B3]NET45702.1 hypothetical protein [Okeania sp. SIO2B3]